MGVYEVDATRVSNLAWSGPAPPAHPVFPITQGLTGRAVAERRTVNVGEVAQDPNYLAALRDPRSEIIVPLWADDPPRVVGTIDVESEKPKAFDPEAQAFLEDCARAVRRLFEEEAEPFRPGRARGP